MDAMNLLFIPFTLMAFVLNSSFAHAGSKVSGNEAEIERGRSIARANCARCHGIGPNDQSPNEEAPPFGRIVERYPIQYLAEALAEGIVVGHKEMPPFEFQTPEIESLLAYLGDLQRSEESHK
jgi:mono/diheme cytochrome c family protein